MKLIILIIFFSQISIAKTISDINSWKDPVKEAFISNKVKLKKVEVQENGYATYYVELPWDPNLGHNSKSSNKLYINITKKAGCKDFSLFSILDDQEIKLATKIQNKKCSIDEQLQELNR